MLIRKTDYDDPDYPEKYYVCYASDGGAVSSDTHYRHFSTKKSAREYIIENNGREVTE